MAPMPYFAPVKMTMHIDEKLLGRVMKQLGTTNKTRAVERALKELDRKAKLNGIMERGLGLSPEKLKTIFHPKYDLSAMRALEKPSRPYGKSRAGR